MKQLITMACIAFMVGAPNSTAQQKKFTEKIKKEISFSETGTNALIIRNVFGSISVEGYSGNTVIVEVEKTITSDNTEGLELGKQELQLKVIQGKKGLILHPDAPYVEFDENNLRYNWCNNHEKLPYEHDLTFSVKVPYNAQVDVGTVNNGEVLVANTRGSSVKARNINGGITLTNITGKTLVNCVNGAVNITYADNPTSSSKYYSLNGDINISYQEALSANISFKSMNGEMFTDFAVNKQYLRTQKQSSEANKPKYKYDARPIVQIGSGKVDFDFETLNGNVFIKKI